MSEIFTERPEHPDFELLTSIIRSLDAQIDTAEDKDAVWEGIAIQHVDVHTLSYVAIQRAFRLLNIKTAADLAAKRRDVSRAAAMWAEAFLVGSLWGQQKAQHHE